MAVGTMDFFSFLFIQLPDLHMHLYVQIAAVLTLDKNEIILFHVKIGAAIKSLKVAHPPWEILKGWKDH